MRTFLSDAFNEVFITCMAIIIFITETDTGNNRCPCLWSSKPEHKFKPGRKEVLPDHKEDRPPDSLPVQIGPEAVEHYSCIDLPPVPDIPVQDYRVIADFHRGTGYRRNTPAGRSGQALRCTVIPKNMDIHSNTILE